MITRRKFLTSMLVATASLVLPVKAIAGMLPKEEEKWQPIAGYDRGVPLHGFEGEPKIVRMLAEELRKDIDNELLRRINNGFA